MATVYCSIEVMNFKNRTIHSVWRKAAGTYPSLDKNIIGQREVQIQLNMHWFQVELFRDTESQKNLILSPMLSRKYFAKIRF